MVHNHQQNLFKRSRSMAGWIDADLLRGGTGAVALESISSSGGTLTVVYRDESNAVQTIAFAGGTGSTEYYPIPDSGVAGTGDAIVITSGQSISAYTNGLMLYFNSFAANTGAVTIDLDGIGTRRMLGSSGQGSGADLAANTITAGDPLLGRL